MAKNIFAKQLGNAVGYVFVKQGETITLDKLEKPVNIGVGQKGLYHIRKTDAGIFTVKTEALIKPVLGLAEVQEGYAHLLPKVPFRLWLQGLAFVKAVHKRDYTEASLILFYNKEKQEYFWYCPEQINTASESDFLAARDKINEMSNNGEHICIGEFHSHGSGGAFSSHTDNENENLPLVYGVWGKVNASSPEFHFRMVCAGIRKDINVWDVFEQPSITVTVGDIVQNIAVGENYNGPYPNVEFPEEWMTLAKKKVIWVTGARGGYNQGYLGSTYGDWDEYGNTGITKSEKKDTPANTGAPRRHAEAYYVDEEYQEEIKKNVIVSVNVATGERIVGGEKVTKETSDTQSSDGKLKLVSGPGPDNTGTGTGVTGGFNEQAREGAKVIRDEVLRLCDYLGESDISDIIFELTCSGYGDTMAMAIVGAKEYMEELYLEKVQGAIASPPFEEGKSSSRLGECRGARCESYEPCLDCNEPAACGMGCCECPQPTKDSCSKNKLVKQYTN